MPRGKLSLLQLAAATYLMVSGGPYGTEELVQNCGYAGALALVVVLPLIWSLPVGLMVGELAAAIPAEGGFYIWVRRALGPFWGFQEAWLSLTASIFDMAVYPTLFVAYLGRLWPSATGGERGFLIGVIFVAACVLWNLCGARAVGGGSVWLGALLLSPFVVVVAAALVRHPLSAAAASPAHRDWLAGVLVAMWNYMGWDNASTVAAEVENPQRTYPRVMLLALAVIMFSYVIPFAAAWRAQVPVTAWATGSWVAIAAQIAGPPLGVALLAAAMLSSFGMFNSLTLSLSRLPLAMAEVGYAPRCFARKLANGVPWVALLACGTAWIAALRLTFDRLLMLDILLYGVSLILEFVALAALRIREPKLERPFRVPGGFAGALLAGVGPALLLLIAAVVNRHEQMGSVSALTVGVGIMALGVVLYRLVPKRR